MHLATTYGTLTVVCTDGIQTKNLATGASYDRSASITGTKRLKIKSLPQLAAALTKLSTRQNAYIVRGTPNTDVPPRRSKEHFADEPQCWVMLDVDSGHTLDEAIARLPAPFARASCVWQASASAVAAIGGKWHLWYLLDKPLTCAQLRAWIGKQPNHDPAALRVVQPLYVADPIGAGPEHWSGPRYGEHQGLVEVVEVVELPHHAEPVDQPIQPRSTGTDWTGAVPVVKWKNEYQLTASGYLEAYRVGTLVGVQLARETWNDVEHGHDTWRRPARRTARAIGEYVVLLPDAKHDVETYTKRAYSGIKWAVAQERARLAARVEAPVFAGPRDAAWRRAERATDVVAAIAEVARFGAVTADEIRTRLPDASPAEIAAAVEAAKSVTPLPTNEWLSVCERDRKNGTLRATELNVLQIAQHEYKGQFRRNVMSLAVEYTDTGDEVELDVVAHRLFDECVRLGMPRVTLGMARTVTKATLLRAPEYNPLLERIKPRSDNELLERWLVDWFGCEDTPYVRAIGARTLVALFARAYKPGYKHDTVLVLCGPQGAYKSSTLETLGRCIYPRGYASAGSRPLYERDTKEAIRSAYICEIAELAAMTSRFASADALKDYITSTEDTYRAAYAAESKTYKRRSVLIGTTNDSDFLTDSTNRRFWPVELPATFTRARKFTQKRARRLLAAAHAAWLDGSVPTYLTAAEEALRAAQAAAAAAVTEVDELTEGLALLLADRRGRLTNSELRSLAAQVQRSDGRQGWSGKRLARSMLALGWRKGTTHTDRIWSR